MLFHRFTLGDLVTNSYIAADEKTKNAVLFDAPAEPETILNYIETNGLKLKKILLTHAHFDHIMALKKLQSITGADCLLYKAEEKYLADTTLNLADVNTFKVGTITDYKLLNEGDIISVDSISIKVIHTPGHTTGSVCYLVNDTTLISGDTLFSGSIGRADFPLGNFDDEINSIKNKLMLLDDDVKVYPGHGFSTTIGKQRKENPYLI